MSRSLAKVVETPSYGETHLPEVAAQEESVTTLLPSRFNTAKNQNALLAACLDLKTLHSLSRVLQDPETENWAPISKTATEMSTRVLTDL